MLFLLSLVSWACQVCLVRSFFLLFLPLLSFSSLAQPFFRANGALNHPRHLCRCRIGRRTRTRTSSLAVVVRATCDSQCWPGGEAVTSQRTPWGGGKRRGVENLTNDTPPKKGFWTPLRTVRFPPPSGVSTLFFLYKNPRQSSPEAPLEGSKNFRESAFSGTFSSPHTFCTPPYHGPNFTVVNALGPQEVELGHSKVLGWHVCRTKCVCVCLVGD